MLLGVLFCTLFSVQVVMVHIVPHITDLGISMLIAASVLTIVGGLSIGGRIMMGGVADKIGSKPALIVCVILVSVTLLWLLVAKQVWMFYLFAAIFGFAYGGFTSLCSPMVAELFGLRSHGVILGIVTFGATIGGAISPTLAGHIFDITGSYQLAFLLCLALGVVAIMLTFFLRPTSNEALREIH